MTIKTIPILLLFALPVVVFARLGETRAQMTARFGEPKFVGTQPVTKKITVKNVRWYTKTMTIDAVELDGKMISESYHLMRRQWTAEEIRTARETQVPNAPEKSLGWKAEGETAWTYLDQATAALLDDGRTLRFRVWGYDGKLNPYAKPESL